MFKRVITVFVWAIFTGCDLVYVGVITHLSLRLDLPLLSLRLFSLPLLPSSLSKSFVADAQYRFMSASLLFIIVSYVIHFSAMEYFMINFKVICLVQIPSLIMTNQTEKIWTRIPLSLGTAFLGWLLIAMFR